METVVDFEVFELNDKLLASLHSAGYKQAAPIQEMTIPPVLEGTDIFAQAETGSGKTASFAIPILEKILRDNEGEPPKTKELLYIVLSPTRELAQQTHKVFTQLGKELGVKSVCVIGGENLEKQVELISKGGHILVATPGRLLDLFRRKAVSFKTCKGVVFDEADRLFDMGFKKDIERILDHIPRTRQFIMVSATTNFDVLNTAYKYHSDPKELKLNEDSLLVDSIDHKLAMVTQEEKMPLLVSLLRKQEDAYALIFCNTQFQTHLVATWLKQMSFKAEPISGRLTQNRRTSLLKNFRSKNITVLVCTDVAARGLDIKDVNLVVNYDLPSEAANYVHRIGRTGRAGKDGFAISFCAHEDCENLDPIYELIQTKIEKMNLTNEDFATDLCKKPYIDSKTLRLSERPERTTKTRENMRSRNNSEKRDYTNEKTVERKKRPESEVGYQGPRIDRRFYETITRSPKRAESEAMNFMRINDRELLGVEVLEEGKRKFFFFGARKNKYKFYVKPIYKKLLTPFLEKILFYADLDLQVSVSFKAPNVRVRFSGKDEKLLFDNNKELLDAFEQLISAYLIQRTRTHRGLRFSLMVGNQRMRANSKQSGERSNFKEKKFIEMANKVREDVLKTQKSVMMDTLSPADRRIIHKHLEQFQDVTTTSVGDGRYKKIRIDFVAH